MAFNDKDKVDLKKKFLTEFGKTRTISSAVSGLPVGRNSIYEWFKENIKKYAETISNATGIKYLYNKIKNFA